MAVGFPLCSTTRLSSLAPQDRAKSEVRRWIIENDWLEGIVTLPDQLFYNTGIPACIMVLRPKDEKPEERPLIHEHLV